MLGSAFTTLYGPLYWTASRSVNDPVLRAVLLSFVAAALAGCGGSEATMMEPTPDPAAADAEWVSLFDGASLAGWRAFGGGPAPSAWRAEDGALRFDPTGGERGDLIAEGVYGDFELELEYRISECGNSGVFYRAAEGDGLAFPWQTGPEYQVLDDCHPDAQYPSHTAGSLYDLYVPTADAARPAGEWNAVRIVVRGDRVEHWLNGERVVEAEVGSADWDARQAASKFRDPASFPGFGTYAEGVVGLQDHGDDVWYRNLRLRPL